jgi:tripartite-type tricarboxylate transporter receptor subunit TctC
VKIRYVLAAALGGITLAATVPAWSQQYPVKPIRMIVALAAGGPTDVVARIVAHKLTEQMGQQVIVDNRPGAGGSVAGEMVARAPADGYTLFFAANGTYAIAPNFMKLPYELKKDLTPVALTGVSPLALMVHPSVPAKTAKDLIALARVKPGAIHYGSAGQGSTGHLAAELLAMMASIKLTHVPYRGAAPAAIALISGEVEMLISGVSANHPHIAAGKVRALGVTSAKRVPLLPQVPAIAESLPGYDVSSWFAITTVAGTPTAVVARLNQETVKAMGSNDVREKLIAAGVDPETGTPEQLAAKLRVETEKWGKVVKAAGMKVQ